MTTLPQLTLQLPKPRLWHVVLIAFVVGTASAADIAGFTKPSRDLDLAAGDSGRIRVLNVEEGDTVVADQVVARTEADALEASRRISETQIASKGRLMRAQAELRMQTKRLEKLTDLLARNHAGQEEVDRATIDREIAAAAVQTAEEERLVRISERNRIDVQLAQREIRTPIDGIVVHITKDVGEFVSPADPVVMRVVRLDPLTATFPVPERLIGELQADTPATVVFPRTGREQTGTVSFIAPVVEAQSGTVLVKITLPNPDRQLLAGEKCMLRLEGVEQVADAETDVE